MKNVFKTTLRINGEYLGAELVEFGDKEMLLHLESNELVIMKACVFEMWCNHPELNLTLDAPKNGGGLRHLH